MNFRLFISRLVLVLCAGSAVVAPDRSTVYPEEVGISSERLERLSDVLRGYVHDGQLAGAVALVARDGEVAYLEAFGLKDRESASPMETNTIFRLASQTKALVSIGVMMLVV